jgi:ADP-ribosylation factor protein 1
MGLTLSRLFDIPIYVREIRILVLGLEGAGKTTFLRQLKRGEVTTTIPTIDFNIETVQYNNINFTAWDLGKDKILSPGSQCFQNVQCVIYVVDSHDHERIREARDELRRILNEDGLRNAILLVFANKQDLPGAMIPPDVAWRLGLYSLNRVCYTQGTCATSGEGLYEGLEWLSNRLKPR